MVRLAIVKNVAIVVKKQGFDFKFNPSLETNAMWSEVDLAIRDYVTCKGVVPTDTMTNLIKAINKSLQTDFQKPIRFVGKEAYTNRPSLEIFFCLWMLQLECDDRLDPHSRLHPYNGRSFQDDDLKMYHSEDDLRRVENFLDLAPVTYPGDNGFLCFDTFVSLAAAPKTKATLSENSAGSQANSNDTLPLIQALTRVLGRKDKSQEEKEGNKNAEEKGPDLKRRASKSEEASEPAKKKQAVGDSKADTDANADVTKASAKNSGSEKTGDEIAQFLMKIGVVFDNAEQQKTTIRSLLDRIPKVDSDEPGGTANEGEGDKLVANEGEGDKLATNSIADVTNDAGDEDKGIESSAQMSLEEENNIRSEDEDDDEEYEDEDDDEEEMERTTICELLAKGNNPQMKNKKDSVRLSLADTIKKGHLYSTRQKQRQLTTEDDTFITTTFENDTSVERRDTALKKYAEKYNVVVRSWYADEEGKLQSKTIEPTDMKTTSTSNTRAMHIYVNQKYQPKNASEAIVLKGYALLSTTVKTVARKM